MMAPKEESELMVIKKACQVSVDLFNKYLKEQVMEIVDADKKVWAIKFFFRRDLIWMYSSRSNIQN